MASVRTTTYAPEIYKALNGIILLHKPARVSSRAMEDELREYLADSLNSYEPRPIAQRLLIQGDIEAQKSIVKVPNLADHPLVVGPRFLPWEMRLATVHPFLSFKSSGLNLLLLGDANKLFFSKMNRAKMISVYHITGNFGYATDTCLYDGKIIDKATIKHIGAGRLDAALSRIESTQYQRLFDAASVPLDSQQAYELAKAWPSRPPKMAAWPVIYRIRCIHLKLPCFKIEVAICNENEQFLARLCNDIGLMMKSFAFTESIRRVKVGPFDINESLTEKDWTMQNIVNHLAANSRSYNDLSKLLVQHNKALQIRTQHHMDSNRKVAEP